MIGQQIAWRIGGQARQLQRELPRHRNLDFDRSFPEAEERRVIYGAVTLARQALTIAVSNVRPSSFLTEPRIDPAYLILAEPGAEPQAQDCGECGGRLLGLTWQGGRIWYCCENVQRCGNLLPACKGRDTQHGIFIGAPTAAASQFPASGLRWSA